MAEALHIDRDRLLLSPPDRSVPKRFWDMVSRRSDGEPIAYITGRRAFWNIELHVGPGVLVPRPDSEVLIASAIEHFEGTAGPKRILDLGTGPGTLLLAALDIWPDATGLGIDVSRQALSYASANARRLGFEGRAKLMQGNWAAGLLESFDLVLCNPPYVAEGAELGPGVREFEPDEALFAGSEGLDAYRELAPQLPRLLNPGGLAAIEIGPGQSAAVTALLERDGLKARVADDLGGRARAIVLTWM
jgi:release factor glutamine methyltransferase